MLRAVHWATQLLSHCQSLYGAARLSADDYAQATVYTLILNGRVMRHRYAFNDAIMQLCVARGLLDALATHAPTSREQALAVAFADEIGPEIRHCAHELRRERAYEIDAIVAELAPKYRNALVEGCDALLAQLGKARKGAAQERGKLRELVWEDEPVPVRNPELVDVLLKVQDAEARLLEAAEEGDADEASADGGKKKGKTGAGSRSKRGVASYDAVLSALSDAEDVSRKLTEAQKVGIAMYYSESRAMLTLTPADRLHCRGGYTRHPLRPCVHRLSAPLVPRSARPPPHVDAAAPAASLPEGQRHRGRPRQAQSASRRAAVPGNRQAARQRDPES